jgi:hypothetical protein
VSQHPDDPQRRELRASDADRERVANILNQALSEGRLDLTELDERLQKAYAAKTFGELAPLTADLPTGADSALVARPTYEVDNRIGGVPGDTGAIAVMTGVQRKGRWVVPPHFTAVAMMGGLELDLTEAQFAEAHTSIQCFAFMGGVDITVPEDITVHVNGSGLLGGFDHRRSKQGMPGTPGGPIVTITGFAMLGGVNVRRPKRRRRDQLGRDRRDQLER